MAVSLGCGGADSATGPNGTAAVSLVTPNADDGVVLLTPPAPARWRAISDSSYKVYGASSRRAGGRSWWEPASGRLTASVVT
jgi:hypothetical protein